MDGLFSQMPLIVISRENLLAANDMLDREQKGELLEMIIDAVRNDGHPTSEDRYVNGIFNQFMSVIERKASAYFGRKKHMDEVNEQKKKGKKAEEPQVSTYTDAPLPPPPSRPKPSTSIEGPDYENRTMEEIAEYLYGIYLTKTDDAVYREMNGNPYLRRHYNEVNAAYIDIKNKHREAYV